MVGLFVAPIGYAIYLGFTNIELLGPHAQVYNFTGLANVQRIGRAARGYAVPREPRPNVQATA